MYKFKFFIDFEKEEKWLEKMSRDGYHLKSIFMGYQFQRGKPEDAMIKVDFRKFQRKEDFIDYCTLFEDSGWLHLAGAKNSGLQYFKRIDPNAGDDIFSDSYSKVTRYKRYANKSFELAISFIPLLIIFYFGGTMNFDIFTNPKDLYYTPGLWNETGSTFWFSFLLETPIALLRGISWAFIPLTVILYLFFGYKSNKLYLQKRN